jgi:excisionase family DNA binding protein
MWRRAGRGGSEKDIMKRSATPMAEDRKFMTTLEVAEYLHCHYSTVYRLAQRGGIPGGFRLGGSWRFLKSEIDKWIAKGGGQRPSEKPAVKPEGGAHKRKPRPRSR